MLDIKSDKSIILGLGDLKLKDTEYTLRNEKTINGIYYKPIFPTLEWEVFYEPYNRLLNHLVIGETRAGVETTKDDRSIFYGYAANRLSSNASNIVLGILNREYSYFIQEYFDSNTIYSVNPELKQRCLALVYHWKEIDSLCKTFLIYDIYSKKTTINKKVMEYWEILEPRIMEFQDAFSDEQLNQLSLRRKR